MKIPERPPEEGQRLSALETLQLLDTPPEERFDRVTRLAAQLFDVPIALVSLVDKDRQWFKSCYGLGVKETARDISFCGHAILGADIFVVENALEDNRFTDNPLVTGHPNIRFYAGAPLEDRVGNRLGTLCLIDTRPRAFSTENRQNLRDLADLVEREFQFVELGAYYGERTRALNILNEIALDTEGTVTERIQRALAAACEFLSMNTGIVSHITGQAYTIQWHHEQGKPTLSNGMTLPLERTYCAILLQHSQLMAISHMARSPYNDHPCYKEFGLESYLATPIWMDGEIVGTVNFSSRLPKRPGFTETEKMFVNLLARWIADMAMQQQHSETLNKLVSNAPGMLYQFRLWPDSHSTFPYTSQGIQDIYGVTGEAAARDARPVFEKIHPDDLPAVAESIRRSAEQLTVWHHQYRIHGKDGSWRWVEGQANPETLTDGSILWHGYIMDISERHKTELLKSEFISTVSHELRTPLTSIAGSLGLILGGATGLLPEKTEKMLSIARRNTDQLRALIDDLLDIEKLASGKMQLHPSRQLLSAAVKAAIEEIRPYAGKSDISIHLDTSTPTLKAVFDPVRLKQALANLLSNAVKFSPEKSQIHVRVKQTRDQARIEVQDQGSGIPEHFRDRVFQRFAQADSSSTRAQEGTGLGLAVTRELMLAMNGEVGFESEPGKGTTFWMTLPVKRSGKEPPEPAT